MADDFDLLRRRREAYRPSTPGPPAAGSPAFLGRVVSTGDDITVGKFLQVEVLRVLGLESSGASGTLALTGALEWVYLVGPGEPETGDDLICRAGPDRWMADFAGPDEDDGTYASGGCPCSRTPKVMVMTSSSEGCGFDYPWFYSATLRWQDTPPEWVAVGYGPKVVLSDETFEDSGGGEEFRYFFSCEPGAYTLRRIFPVSIFGSPYLDVVRYSWSFTHPENTCTPFGLNEGASFDADPGCIVTVAAAPPP